MRLRLGSLQSSAAVERQIAREKQREREKAQAQIPTVKTEAQVRAEEAAGAGKEDGDGKAKEKEKEAEKEKKVIPRIRPLSEAKAIDMGANFMSESFLFAVAAGIIIFESLRARRKETNRREDVADRLAELEESENNARRGLVLLEHEIFKMRAQMDKKPLKEIKEGKRILPREIWELEEEVEEEESPGLMGRITGLFGWIRGEEKGKPTSEEQTAKTKAMISTAPVPKTESPSSDSPEK